MTDSLAAGIAKRLRSYRKQRGLSAPGLAKECATAGMPELTESSIVNLERPAMSSARPGRRLTVDQWLALAHVLHVPPIAMLLPLGRSGATVELVPGIETPVEQALAWLTSTTPEGLDGEELADLSSWHSITHLRNAATPRRKAAR
jgi:transcriptional regulator with XRE-family HTH domain